MKEHKIFLIVPYIYLLKEEDIPAEFKKENEPIPYKMWASFFHWSQDYFYQRKAPFNFKSLIVIGLIAHLVQNKTDFEQAKEFILGHELSHAYYKHESILHAKRTLLAISLTALAFFYAHYKTAGLPRGIIKGACTMVGIALFSYLHGNLKKSRAQEAEADRLSARLSNESKNGGIYLFNQAKKANEIIRHTSLFRFLFYDFQMLCIQGSLNQRLTNISQLIN